jgi:hypothetical protein
VEEGPSSEVASVASPPQSGSEGSPRVAWIVAAVALAVFLPSVLCGFVFDDVLLISENHYAQSLEHLGRAFTTHLWDIYKTGATGDGRRYYRPIVAVTYLINWVMADGRPWTFHLFNVVCHAGVVFLAARCARRWTGHAGLGVVAALAFALHPSRAESVTWISGRTDLVMVLFMLGAVECAHAASRASGGRSVAFGAGAFAATVLAIMSKENAVCVGLFIAVDAALARDRARRLLTVLALATGALGAAYAVARALFYPIVAIAEPTHLSLGHGFVTCWAYLERLVFPWPQTFFHRTPVSDTGGRMFPLPLIGLGVLVVLGYLALMVRAWRRDRPALWLLIATAALFGPLLNFTDSGIGVTTSDRFLYLPILPLTCALFRMFRDPLAKLLDHRTAVLAGVGVLVAWVAIVEVRMLDYRDDDAFWGHEYSVDATNPMAISQVSRLHAQRGELEEALELLKQALAPETSRYRFLSTPKFRGRTYLQALSLHAALTADGDVRMLSTIFGELEPFLRGEPRAMRGHVADIVLGVKMPRSTVSWLEGSDSYALFAEGAMVAARLGQDALTRAYLERIPDEQIWRTENPLNVALTHARIGSFDRARSILAVVANPPAGVPGFGPDEVEQLRGRIERAERGLKAAAQSPVDRAPVMRAVAMAELGAYLRGLKLVRPLYDANPNAPGIGPLYVQLLVAARLDQEAVAQATRLLGPERGGQTVASIRDQLPARIRQQPAPKEPSPWWKP